MNLGARRQKSQVLRVCFYLVSYSLLSIRANCIIIWSERRQTGYSMGVTVRIKSALHLVKKIERAKSKGRHRSEPRDESILKKFRKPQVRGGFLYQFKFHQIPWPKPYYLNVGNRQDDKRYF